MSLDNVVNLTISRSAPAVSRQGFGVALILGSNATGWNTDRVRTYNKPAEMLEDGFTSGNPEYKAALALYGQAVKPAKFMVGRRLVAAAQVVTVTPDVTTQDVQNYLVSINGVDYAFTSDADPTASEVVSGLAALINAGTEPVTASGTTTLVLTADKAGISFEVALSDNLDGVTTTANAGIASDIAGIKAINNDWYGLILTSRDSDDILEAAKIVEADRKIFATAVSDAAVIAAGTSDIASRLKAKSYSRTFIIYSADAASFPDAAALGNILPRAVGSYTLKFKTLAGITADTLTGTQYNVARSKHANIHTVIAGAGMVEEGVMTSGEFIDVTIGIDWIHVNMQADIFQILRDNPKIPYTNAGSATIQNAVQNRLRLAVVNGILTEDPAPVVIAPLISNQDPGDKATRTLGGISFTAYLAGAVHAVVINGSVLVA